MNDYMNAMIKSYFSNAEMRYELTVESAGSVFCLGKFVSGEVAKLALDALHKMYPESSFYLDDKHEDYSLSELLKAGNE